MIEFSHKIQSK